MRISEERAKARIAELEALLVEAQYALRNSLSHGTWTGDRLIMRIDAALRSTKTEGDGSA